MNFLPEPDPVVLAFFGFRRFVYLEVLAVLALLRVVGGGALARWPALVALALALAGVATTLAPLVGATDGAAYAWAARILAEGGGMAALLVPSVLMALSGLMPDARWKTLDGLHGLLLAVLLGLWWWTS